MDIVRQHRTSTSFLQPSSSPSWGRAHGGYRATPPARCKRVHRNSLWPFGDWSPVTVPKTMEEAVQELQNSMLSLVEETVPLADIEVPPGARLGVETDFGELESPSKKLPPEEIERGDRELAAAVVLLFVQLKLSQLLCVAFRTNSLAARAKKVWKEWGYAAIFSFPPKSKAEFGKGISGRRRERTFKDLVAEAIKNGYTYLALVAPRAEQLKEVADLDPATKEKLCIISLNGRLRGRKSDDELRQSFARQSEALFHLRLTQRGKGIVYKGRKQEGEGYTPWVLARRTGPEEAPKEIARFDSEPSRENLESAFAQS